MSKFRYEISEWQEPEWQEPVGSLDGHWETISAAEGEAKLVAIGLRAMAELIAPSPTLGDVFRDIKTWFSEHESDLTEAFNEGAKFRDPTHTPEPTA